MAKSIRKAGKASRLQLYPIDKAWKAAVRQRMAALRITQAELARRVGASPPAVVLLFKRETIQSGFVPAIHRELGLEPPHATRAIEAAQA